MLFPLSPIRHGAAFAAPQEIQLPPLLSQALEHPRGFSLLFPADWRIEQQQESYRIVEPGAPRPLYTLKVDDMPEAIAAGDVPAIMARYSEGLKERFPALALQPIEMVETAVGTAMQLTWRREEEQGTPLQAALWVAEWQGRLVALEGVGTPDQMKERQGLLRRIFATLSGPQKTHRLTEGLAFQLPATWSVREENGQLMLAPPDGTAETYTFTVGPMPEGIAVYHPDLQHALDQEITAGAPFLKLSENAAIFPTRGGVGIRYTWTGNLEDGSEVQVDSFLTIIEDHLISLSAVSSPRQIRARTPALLRIFMSLRPE